MAKSKKPKKKAKRIYRSQPHKVTKINSLVYTKLTVKWLPRTDEYQVYVDMKLNNQRLLMLGTIDPDSSYDTGIRIYCKRPLPWMSCNEIQLSRADAPNLFVALLGYFHTIGDLLDEGASIDEIPSAIAFKEGTTFSDGELLDIFELIK